MPGDRLFFVAAQIGMAPGAQIVPVGAKLGVLVDVRIVSLAMTIDTGHAALQKTFALPQPHCVI
jgi:hypothetical protein